MSYFGTRTKTFAGVLSTYAASPLGATENSFATGSLQDSDTLRHFETAFAGISEGSKVTIIAEGVPLRQSLTDDDLKALQHSLAGRGSRSIESVISRVAGAYDYEAERTRTGIFLLRKCYSDPNDLPCATFEEIVHGIGALIKFIDPEPPEPVSHGKDSVLWTLWDALTPDQQAQGPKGLRVSEMPTEQRALAMRATRFAILQTPLFHLQELISQLRLLGDEHSVFTWMKMVGGDSFGYQGPFRDNGAIRQFPLTNGFAAQIGGAYSHTTIRSILPAGNVNGRSSDAAVANRTEAAAAPVLPDPAEPTDLDRFLAAGMLTGRLPATLTLGDLAGKLTRAGLPADNVTLEDGIAEKPVSLYGQSFTSNHDLARAIADLYGLQLTVGGGGVGYRIVMPRARFVEKPEDAVVEIFRLLPTPVSRYLLAQASRIVDNKSASNPDWEPNKIAERLRKYNSGFVDFNALQNSERTLYYPAVRRLLVLAFPKVPAPTSPPVPVASLGPEAGRLIAFAMLSGSAMRAVSHLSVFKPPHCLSDPDSLLLRVYMGIHPPGAPYAMVDVIGGYTNREGVFVNEGGFGTSRDVPKPAQTPSADPQQPTPTQAP